MRPGPAPRAACGRMRGGMGFTKATIDYLNGLPAVRRVGDGCIQYDPEFIGLFAALRHEGAA